MRKLLFISVLISVISFLSLFARAQQNATYREVTKEYLTYPFSDPNPIPSPSQKIYPYYRFDGFTDKGVIKEWKVVELENDYIKVQIMPEIGGKVWTALDKKSGKHFLYNNGVVKFRDIAMRGPWVSGGIEVNYGIIGHTPNTATPVDYLVRSNDDGSVSCFVSTLDLLTRTRWTLEIKLEKDRAYFSTASYWFNSRNAEQPYYTWMNAAVPAGDDLVFLYEGSHYIDHDGGHEAWPISNGRDLSHYSENDFGGSKSYHVLGVHSNYFGTWWKEDDFGMIHYSRRRAKLGKKIFLWAQSGEGKIWEDLLTDESGQYVEIQSGRLFNQNLFTSSFTPFKQIGLMPYRSERWIEYWYPFQKIDGFTSANLVGAFNIQTSGDSLSIKISPVRSVHDSLRVYNKEGKIMATAFVKAPPLEAIEIKLLMQAEEKPAKITLEDHTVDLLPSDHPLSRPLEIAEGFDAESAYGLYLQGRDLARFRSYHQAEEKIRASLAEDPAYLPALVEMAKLKLFRMQYDSAFYYARKALSIDTYHGEANYYYGLAALQSGRHYDAVDGLEVAGLTPMFRNASNTALSHLYMKQGDLMKAEEYARLTVWENPDNMDALQLLHVLARINSDEKLLQETKNKIQRLNPLSHFLRFETYYQTQTQADKHKFTGLIRNEMPVETFLELAIWYTDLGRREESKRVLEAAPQNPVTLYWLAWLNRMEDIGQSEKYLQQAGEAEAALVFPFRSETIPILAWAAKQTDSWKPGYFQALIHDFKGNRKEALAQIQVYDEKIAFAPFYAFRAQLYDKDALAAKRADITTAARVDPREWRYGILMSETLVESQKYQEAVQVLKKYYKAEKANYVVGMQLVRTLMLVNRYREAEKILSGLQVMPFEGASDAREYYRETKLMLAHLAMEEGQYPKALKKIEEAEEWPVRLGVGKPYPDLIDNSLENWMKATVYKKMGNNRLYQEYFNKVDNENVNESTYLEMIRSTFSDPDQRMF